MKKKITIILLTTIILLASILRLWHLGQVPVSPDWDEAALGYNAYSVMLTGHDEYGKYLPLIMRSFNDYKPALYIYLAIPSIAVFGLDTFAVRLPSAIFGILTVLVTYLLVKELFCNREATRKYAEYIALLSAFLLAISPWHIQFSRVAFEANIGVALNVFAVYLFIKGLKKPWLLSLSFILLALNLYTYQSEKVFVPLLGMILLFVYRKEFFSLPKKYLLTAFIVGFIIAMPILQLLLTDKQLLARARGVSIFSDQTLVVTGDQQRYLDDRTSHNYIGMALHNKRLIFVKEALAGYLSHFNPNWLFVTGDLARHHPPHMGMLYLWELPFILIGIYFLFVGPFSKETKLLIFLWFLSTPIPASVTSGVPHAVRTENFLPTFQIFSALGIFSAYMFIKHKAKIKKQIIRISIYMVFLMFVAFNFIYYLDQYFVQLNYFDAKEWQYGFKELVTYLDANHQQYKKVVVSNRGTFDQAYIFFLYYLKYDPAKYLSEGGTKITKEEGIEKFSNYEFKTIDYKQETDKPILIVAGQFDLPSEVSKLKTFYYPDGSEAMYVVEKK